ncbi:uncharacterized protein nms isoform 2-T2 [Spinachia spinachia]
MSRWESRLVLLASLGLLGGWSTTDAALVHRWGHASFRKVRGIESEDLRDVLWRDRSNEKIQNVFKRFLFHYSKARNSVGALQHESTSVHPLMRLSPKLSQGRKKKFWLLVSHHKETKHVSCSFFLCLNVTGCPTLKNTFCLYLYSNSWTTISSPINVYPPH